jgi:hypothetical protein
MRHTFNAKIKGNKIDSPGIDWGPKGLQIVERKPPYYLTKWGGYTGWSGVGMTDYNPVYYGITRDLGDGRFETVKEIASDRSTWRKIRQELSRELEAIGDR